MMTLLLRWPVKQSKSLRWLLGRGVWTLALAPALAALGACRYDAPAFSDRCEQWRWEDDTNCAEDTTTTPPSTTPVAIRDCTSGAGACVEEAPDGWMGPNLYWIGPTGQQPPCPEVAPLPGTTLFSELGQVPHACPSCTCAPSETSCSSPTKWMVSGAKCSSAEGAPQTSFEVGAPDWSGDCSTDNAIEPGAQCGGALCTQSLTVAAPEAVGAPCNPLVAEREDNPGPPWPWGRVAQECLVTPTETEACRGENGDEEGYVCIPVPGDLLACISLHHGDHEQEVDCPEFYSERHVMYGSAVDHRECAPCACSSPEGGECAVTVTAFADEACTDFVVGAVIFSSDEQACFDVPSGIALGSKAAEVKVATPGSCLPSGGEPIGEVEPADRVTLCCHHKVAQ